MNLKRRQILGLLLAFLVLILSITPQARSYFYLQEEQRLSVGDSLELYLKFPSPLLNVINVYVKEGEKLLDYEEKYVQQNYYNLGVNAPIAVKPGKVELQLKLFGLIPLKKINVDVLPNINLVPGGHSIGVLLRTEGVNVVGYSPILNKDNEPCFPARDADILIGDSIIEINGVKVLSDDQVKEIVSSVKSDKDKISIIIKRNNTYYKRTIQPIFCYDTKSFRIGLFVRDNAGGVGTLTFFEPNSNKFGALGHVITENESNQKLKIREGKILEASVEDIHMAQRGSPGEKVGMFITDSEMGDIEKNDNCGIYGTTKSNIENKLFKGTLPIAYSNKIHTGKAQILTVIQGQDIKKFDIEVEKLMFNRYDGKSMIIKITDKELLEKTGGIVQGMSGSPIIQDGKIIGAVTHVFVNDPVRGYGVFIENMLFEAGIIETKEKTLGVQSQGFPLFFL